MIYRTVLLLALTLPIINGCTTGVISYESAVLAEEVFVTNEVVKTSGPTKEITGKDCISAVLDLGAGGPTASGALQNLKTNVAQNGFNAVHSVEVYQSKTFDAFMSNCVAMAVAKGIAFNQ